MDEDHTTKINIAFGADNNYAQHMGVCIASILANASENERFHFYILENGISEENKARVEHLSSIKPFELTWLTPDMSMLEGCPPVRYLSVDTFLRLLLPELLPHLERLLYLDCDMVVTSSLAELWHTDLQGYSIATVTDMSENYYDQHTDEGYTYLYAYVSVPLFNAGMMLMDIQRLRANGKFREAIHWASEHSEKLFCADQDALNAIFANDCLRLPYRWNIQTCPVYTEKILADNTNSELCESLLNPVGIIHYITGMKPWHYYYDRPEKKFYWKYLQLTEWKDYCPPAPPFKQRLKHWKNNNRYYQVYRTFRRGIQKRIRNLFYP